MKKYLEKDFRKDLKIYLDHVLAPEVWHFPVEVSSMLGGKTGLKLQKILNGMGVIPGFPDHQIMWYSKEQLKVVFVEAKKPKDKLYNTPAGILKPHQQAIHYKLRKQLRTPVATIWSFEDLNKAIIDYNIPHIISRLRK